MGRRSGTDITFGDMANRTVTLDQAWAEVAFVPAQSYERKASAPPRYVGLRLLKAQGVLFADGSDRKKRFPIVRRPRKN